MKSTKIYIAMLIVIAIILLLLIIGTYTKTPEKKHKSSAKSKNKNVECCYGNVSFGNLRLDDDYILVQPLVPHFTFYFGVRVYDEPDPKPLFTVNNNTYNLQFDTETGILTPSSSDPNATIIYTNEVSVFDNPNYGQVHVEIVALSNMKLRITAIAYEGDGGDGNNYISVMLMDYKCNDRIQFSSEHDVGHSYINQDWFNKYYNSDLDNLKDTEFGCSLHWSNRLNLAEGQY